MSAPDSSSSQPARRGTGRRKQRRPRRIPGASESETSLEHAAPPAQTEPSVTAVDQRDQAGPSSVPAQVEPSVTAVDLMYQPAPLPAPADIDARVVQPPTDSLPHEVCVEESEAVEESEDIEESEDGEDSEDAEESEESEDAEVVDEEPPIPNTGAAVGNGSVPTPENNSTKERPILPTAGARHVPRKRIVIPLGLPFPDGYQLLEGRGRVPARRDGPADPELHMAAASDEDEKADSS